MAMHNARLYWSTEETSWVLWYRDDDGSIQVVEIGETLDASLETLAYQVAACVPDVIATGQIEVWPVPPPRGEITLHEGQIVSFRRL